MTIEEKAKRYDNAIEIARKINSGESFKIPFGWSICEVIFPELKKSEDERIRTAIIHFISHTPTVPKGIIGKETMITWLEKQCEQKPTLPIWKYKKDNTPLLIDSIILNKYGCVAKSPSGAIVSDVWVLDFDELAKLPKEELKNQAIQKPNPCDVCINRKGCVNCENGDMKEAEPKRRMTDKERIREEIERLHEEYRGKKGDADVRRALRTVIFFIDSMQEEPKNYMKGK